MMIAVTWRNPDVPSLQPSSQDDWRRAGWSRTVACCARPVLLLAPGGSVVARLGDPRAVGDGLGDIQEHNMLGG